LATASAGAPLHLDLAELPSRLSCDLSREHLAETHSCAVPAADKQHRTADSQLPWWGQIAVLQLEPLVDCDRCVVMVGMPYPNPTDAELRERMAFMDSAAAKHSSQPGGGGAPAAALAAGSGGSGGGVSPGQQYYQDLCMKVGLPRFCPLSLFLLLAIFPRMSIICPDIADRHLASNPVALFLILCMCNVLRSLALLSKALLQLPLRGVGV